MKETASGLKEHHVAHRVTTSCTRIRTSGGEAAVVCPAHAARSFARVVHALSRSETYPNPTPRSISVETRSLFFGVGAPSWTPTGWRRSSGRSRRTQSRGSRSRSSETTSRTCRVLCKVRRGTGHTPNHSREADRPTWATSRCCFFGSPFRTAFFSRPRAKRRFASPRRFAVGFSSDVVPFPPLDPDPKFFWRRPRGVPVRGRRVLRGHPAHGRVPV